LTDRSNDDTTSHTHDRDTTLVADAPPHDPDTTDDSQAEVAVDACAAGDRGVSPDAKPHDPDITDDSQADITPSVEVAVDACAAGDRGVSSDAPPHDPDTTDDSRADITPSAEVAVDACAAGDRGVSTVSEANEPTAQLMERSDDDTTSVTQDRNTSLVAVPLHDPDTTDDRDIENQLDVDRNDYTDAANDKHCGEIGGNVLMVVCWIFYGIGFVLICVLGLVLFLVFASLHRVHVFAEFMAAYGRKSRHACCWGSASQKQ
jgi:hypothetical protein